MISPRQESAWDDEGGKCELLGPFALFVQGTLGLLALLSLVWKRARENPQRPLKIWFFDVSKQVVGGTMVHMANLLLSMISSGAFSEDPTKHLEDSDANPCSFYLLNIAIDTTIGIPILILILRLINHLFSISNVPFLTTGMTSGYYGNPPKWTWWAKQSFIYFIGLMGMKMVVYLMFVLMPWLGAVGDWMLSWTDGDRRLQVFFVMFFFPLVMNAFQYYVIDSFIKASDLSGFTQLSGDSSPSSSRRGSFDSLHSADSDLEQRSHRPQNNRRHSSSSSGLLTPNGSRSKSVEPKLSTDGLVDRESGAGTPTSFTTRMPLRPTKSSNSTPQLGQNARDQMFGQAFDDDDEGMAAWGVVGHNRQ